MEGEEKGILSHQLMTFTLLTRLKEEVFSSVIGRSYFDFELPVLQL
jgi:hypothetical protein